MNDLKIFLTAKKKLQECFPVEHYLEILFNHPENEWFAPTNKDLEAYAICRELAACYLIAMRQIPIWKGSSFKGIRTEFFYNRDLNYV